MRLLYVCKKTRLYPPQDTDHEYVEGSESYCIYSDNLHT
jgi:hypothetical protein